MWRSWRCQVLGQGEEMFGGWPLPACWPHTNRSLPSTTAEAERAEVLHEPELDFGCTIMVLGLQVRLVVEWVLVTRCITPRLPRRAAPIVNLVNRAPTPRDAVQLWLVMVHGRIRHWAHPPTLEFTG